MHFSSVFFFYNEYMKKLTSPSFHDECIPAKLNEEKPENRIDNHSYIDEDCALDLSHREYNECIFTRVTFHGNMQGMEFVDVIFEHCDLSNVKMSECNFRRVAFKYCRLTGCDLSGSQFRDTSFVYCRGWYINFNEGKINTLTLSESIFTEGAFGMLKFKEFHIENCDLSGTEWIDTKMKDLDFSDSIIDGILVTPQYLKGVIVNPEQAVMMAKLLGIQVK